MDKPKQVTVNLHYQSIVLDNEPSEKAKRFLKYIEKQSCDDIEKKEADK